MEHSDSPTQQPISPSKSQRKRDAKALQEFAESLVALPLKKRADLALPIAIEEAVTAAAAMRKRAYRRQIRFIAGLMRTTGIEPIAAALEKVRSEGVKVAAAHKRTEYWRRQLIENGDTAVAALIEDYPAVDRSHLRQLVRNARHKAEGSVKASRMLYRFVRALGGG